MTVKQFPELAIWSYFHAAQVMEPVVASPENSLAYRLYFGGIGIES